MSEQHCVSMALTHFRTDLTQVIGRLDETGPVRLRNHGSVVAEIRSATPEGDRRYTESLVELFDYLADLDKDMAAHLFRLGVDTLPDLNDFVQRHTGFTEDGVTFDKYPEHCLPDEGSVTVDEALARLYFGDDYPEGVEDPYAWFLACARLQAEAKARGKSAVLPQPNAYDEDASTFVELAVKSGHTPDALIQFGIEALDRDVQLNRLADMLGSDPIPADVLAMESFSEYSFGLLKKYGLTHAEAVAVARKGLDWEDARLFTQAGIRTADEIEKLINEKVDPALAVRAHRDGVAPQEWKIQVPKVQQRKYKGVGRMMGNEGGVLPFQLLAEAAEEGLSLVRWDSNVMPVEGEGKTRSFHVTAAGRQKMYPWVHVYPGRILDVARAGISPSFLAAFGKLMRHYFSDASPSGEFVTAAIQAHLKGLTTGMANAMSRSESKQPEFTPAQLVSTLEEGLSSTGQAHYLSDRYADPDQWVTYLRKRREGQLITDAFVATVENTEAWQAVRDAALEMKGLIKARALHGEVYLKEIVEKFTAGEPLDDCELMILLSSTAHAFGDLSYLPKRWREKHEWQADDVRRLARSFDEARRPFGAS